MFVYFGYAIDNILYIYMLWTHFFCFPYVIPCERYEKIVLLILFLILILLSIICFSLGFFFFWFTSRSAHSEWIIIQKKKNMNVFIPLTMYTGRLNNPCDHPAVYLLWWESCWTHTLTLHLSSYRIRLAFAKKITKLYVCIVTGVLIELREFELKIDGWKTN